MRLNPDTLALRDLPQNDSQKTTILDLCRTLLSHVLYYVHRHHLRAGLIIGIVVIGLGYSRSHRARPKPPRGASLYRAQDHLSAPTGA